MIWQILSAKTIFFNGVLGQIEKEALAGLEGVGDEDALGGDAPGRTARGH